MLSYVAIKPVATEVMPFNRNFIVRKILFVIFIIFFIFLLFCLFQELLKGVSKFLGNEIRWPPIGTIIGSISVFIFGMNEFAARFPSTIFYLGTGYYVYKILRGNDTGRWRIGVCGAVVCLSCPIFFLYGHLDYREAGGAFFLTLGMHYLIRYLKEDSHRHFLMLTFAIIAGFMQRRPVAVMLFIALAVVVLHGIRNMEKWKDKRKIWLLMILCFSVCSLIFLALYPWIHITDKVRPYHFKPHNFLNFSNLTAYIRILPEILSYPITALCFFGFIVSAVKRSVVGLVACVYFLFLYILFTGDDPHWIPVPRFTVLFMPSMAIFVAVLLSSFSKKRVQNACLICIAIMSLASLIIWNSDSPAYGIYPSHTKRLASMPYYPDVDLVKSLKDRKIKHGNVIYPAFWQTASTVYYAIYNIGGYVNRFPDWKPIGRRNTTLPEVKKFCDWQKCVALVIRLERRENGGVELAWINDITYEQLEENNLENFNVESIFFNKNFGLALLVPR